MQCAAGERGLRTGAETLDLLLSVPVLVAAFIGPLALTLFALALREDRSA